MKKEYGGKNVLGEVMFFEQQPIVEVCVRGTQKWQFGV